MGNMHLCQSVVMMIGLFCYIRVHVLKELTLAVLEDVSRGFPTSDSTRGFSCSCRACVRADEAKLCGHVREEISSTLGFRMVICSALAAVVAPPFCGNVHVFLLFDGSLR